MNIHIHVEHVPPKTWQQFEELCADTFSADWSDPALLRHGRGGQRQHGVDIVAHRGNQSPVGLQCKRKSRWPVERLTVADVDKEVAQALKFRPKLKSFYILTTAPDDAKVQAHARKITARHSA
jgi:Restriction endonuclease